MSGHRGKAHRLQAFVQLEKREWNMMRKTSTYGKAIIFVVIVWMVSEIFSFPSVMRQPDTQIKLMNGSFSFNGYFDKLLNNYKRPSTAPSGFPWPTTAAYIQGFEILNVGGLSSITIDNSRKEHDVFVRVVVHTVQGNFPVRQFYIPAFGSFTAKQLTPGEYEIRFQDLITGEMNKFAPHRLEERMTDAGQVIGQGYTVTLYGVINGNAPTARMSKDEF